MRYDNDKSSLSHSENMGPGERTDSKIERHLGIGLVNVGIEACLLVGSEAVCQSSGSDRRGQGGQASKEGKPHCDRGSYCCL